MVLGCFRFKKFLGASVGAMWTERIEYSKVENKWIS